MTYNNYISKIYAKAAFRFAKKEKQILKWKKMLELSNYIIKEKKIINNFSRFLSYKHSIKTFLFISRQFINLPFKNFIKIIAENNRFFLLPNILNEFIQHTNRDNNVQIVHITTSRTLNEKDKKYACQLLKIYLSKKIFIKYYVNLNIIDGVIIKMKDNIINGTIKNKLENLKNSLSS